MHGSLFIDPTLRMEKVAYDIRIDDDPEEWPVSVIRESHKQLPFLQDYETEVEFDKVDTARGYAVGKMLVWPPRMQKQAAAQNRQLVVVPVIIRDREMAPLDVYSHSGSMLPMDQDKVAQVLFQPQMFQGVVPRGRQMGTDLGDQLTPPSTDHQFSLGGLNKQSSDKNWSVLMSTFRSEDINAFGEKLAADHGLKQAYTSTPLLRAALADMLRVAEAEKTASEVRAERYETLKPTVVQFTRHGKGYLCKVANHTCYAPQTHSVSRYEAQDVLSEESFNHLLRAGRLTLTVDPVMREEAVEKTASDASRVGMYRTWRAGRELEGLVIPRMVDFDGNDLRMQLFVGDGTHSMQEKVAGVFLEDVRVASDPPRGLGVFVYQQGEQAFATEPVNVQSIVKVAHTSGSTSEIVATQMSTGSPLKITLVPGIRKIASIGNNIALPMGARFVALPGRQAAVSQSVEDANLFEQQKTASTASLTVRSDGHTYSVEGPNAAVFPEQDLLVDEAEFALCALGLTGTQADGVLKTAAAQGSVHVPFSRLVTSERAAARRALEKVAHVSKLRPEQLRVDLSKELALLTSPKAEELWKQASVTLGKESVDGILSLGFVNPENASLYVAYLPELEKVSSKLAELLVASRLGMDDVRETAAKNAMTQVNAVVRGLEGLRERIS